MAQQNVAGDLAGAVRELKNEINRLGADVTALRVTVAAVQTDVSSLYTRLDGHTHGGVTVGAGSTSAVAAATAKSSSAPSALTKKGLKHDPHSAQDNSDT